MTRQESFKRRIRTRMEKTGERYGAARRALVEQAERRGRTREWVAEPELGDDAVREATGRGWDEWCDLVDAWPGHEGGHAAVVAHVQEHGVDGWWAQTVTVGWERITGRRLRHQRSDGSFSAGRTRTMAVDAAALREALLDEASHADLFPGLETELRSRSTAKVLRVRIGPGTAQFSLEPRDDGRTTVVIDHGGLPSPEEVERWRAYWSEWLDALAGT